MAAMQAEIDAATKVVPKEYALIGIDVLRAWGKLDEVQASCIYAVAAQGKSPSN